MHAGLDLVALQAEDEVVVKLHTEPMLQGIADGCPTPGEVAGDGDGRPKAGGQIVFRIDLVAEARLMHQLWRKGRHVAEPDGVVVGAVGIACLAQRAAADAEVLLTVDVGAVTDEGEVFGAELPVDAGIALP